MFRMIPCVITSYDADGCLVQLATTHSYWGAKRFVKLMVRFAPHRSYYIAEAWNNPMLRRVNDR